MSIRHLQHVADASTARVTPQWSAAFSSREIQHRVSHTFMVWWIANDGSFTPIYMYLPKASLEPKYSLCMPFLVLAIGVYWAKVEQGPLCYQRCDSVNNRHWYFSTC